MPHRRVEDLLREDLKRLGYSVEEHPKFKGRSGVLHDFAMCAEKAGEEEIAVDVEEGKGRPAVFSLLSLYAKALDTSMNQLLLITDAIMTKEAKRAAELYKIFVIPAGISLEELRQQLPDLLDRDRIRRNLQSISVEPENGARKGK